MSGTQGKGKAVWGWENPTIKSGWAFRATQFKRIHKGGGKGQYVRCGTEETVILRIQSWGDFCMFWESLEHRKILFGKILGDEGGNPGARSLLPCKKLSSNCISFFGLS